MNDIGPEGIKLPNVNPKDLEPLQLAIHVAHLAVQELALEDEGEKQMARDEKVRFMAAFEAKGVKPVRFPTNHSTPRLKRKSK
jgi:hypothetical protein